MADNICTCFYCTNYLVDFCHNCKFCNCFDHTKDCKCKQRNCHCSSCKPKQQMKNTKKCGDETCCYYGLFVKNYHKHSKKPKLIICTFKKCYSFKNNYTVWSDSHVCAWKCENEKCQFVNTYHDINLPHNELCTKEELREINKLTVSKLIIQNSSILPINNEIILEKVKIKQN